MERDELERQGFGKKYYQRIARITGNG